MREYELLEVLSMKAIPQLLNAWAKDGWVYEDYLPVANYSPVVGYLLISREVVGEMPA